MLGELHDLGFLFPFVRPLDAYIDAFAWQVVRGMKRPRDTAPDEAAEGLDLLPVEERARIVGSWAGRYPARWAAICRDVGDEALAETTLVASAVRGAVADRICPPRFFAAVLEDGRYDERPALAPAFVLEPGPVWSYEDALSGDRTVTPAHLERTRAQGQRLLAWLPYKGLPHASATLERACGLLSDDEFARRVTDLLFDKYCVGLAARTRGLSVGK